MAKYIKRLIILLTYGVLLLFMSCQQDTYLGVDNDGDKEMGVLRIAIRAFGAEKSADSPENAVRTLRLFVFSEDGNTLLMNKLYYTKDALPTVPVDGSYPYIAHDGDNYQISELIDKQNIRLFVAANGMTDLSKIKTLDELKGAVLEFNKVYNEGGVMNITITGVETDTNKGYIPMSAESGVLTPYQWNAANGRNVEMKLARVLAKVSLKIKGGKIDNLQPGESIVIRSASILRVPTYSFIGMSVEYSEQLVPVKTAVFKTPITITSTQQSLETDKLIFYIPEYLINQRYLDNGQYSAIQINAEYHSSGEVLNSTFKIPLGDGVHKLYDKTNPVTIDKLSLKDFYISRNTEYNMEVTVTTKGQLEVFQIEVGIKPWEDGGTVDGDIEAPRLNVSTLELDMSAKKMRLYFWSNKEPFIENQATTDGNPVADIDTIFDDIAGVGAANFHVMKSDDLYYPYNGYVELDFIDQNLYNSTNTYSIMMNAGGLQRKIDIKSNPVVANVIFYSTTGSIDAITGATFTHNVRYADVGGNPNGVQIQIQNPESKLAPPLNKHFASWSYSPSYSLPVPSNPNICTVTLKDGYYSTSVYALWN